MKKENLNQEIRLIPVMELQPVNFSKVERESPKKSNQKEPEEWIKYNQSCYNDSGLSGIEPIKPLSWLFEIDSLSSNDLKIILQNLIESAAADFESINEIFENPIEYAPLIPGGYLFIVDGAIKSEPICCCGLENILDWKSSEIILTGHDENDFVKIIKKDGQVEVLIREDHFLLSEEYYHEIINNAEISIDRFIERSGELCKELFGIKGARSFVQAMIYKWDGK